MRLGGEGEGGDAKSPEEVALSKVIDKDYVGKRESCQLASSPSRGRR